MTTTSIYQVVMPRLGLTMTEAKVLEWLKSEGSRVQKGQPLFALEYEKATLEIEAPVSGVLHILVPAGQVVRVLEPIGTLETEEAVAASHVAAKSAPQPSSAGEAKPVPASPAAPVSSSAPVLQRLRATPKARAAARARGLNLAGYVGSGLRGMLTLADVEKAASAAPAGTPGVRASPIAARMALDAGIDLSIIPGSGPHGLIMRQDVEHALAAPPRAAAPAEAAPPLSGLTGLRRIIATRLSEAWRDRPQVTLNTEADASRLLALRRQQGEKLGQKVSYNTLLAKIVAGVLAEFPFMNVRLTPQGIQVQPEINIGIAVDTERGLLVPVLRAANTRSIADLQSELTTLTERALTGRSLPEDLAGGTFTITNLGMYAIDSFSAVINPPECAILAVGRILERPVGLDGKIVLRPMLALSLSFDHRLVDGAPAARFLQAVKEKIESE